MIKSLSNFRDQLAETIGIVKANLDKGETTDLTIGAKVMNNQIAYGWQTGDNSYTGGAYCYLEWVVVSVNKKTNKYKAANEIVNRFLNESNAFCMLKVTFSDLLDECSKHITIDRKNYDTSESYIGDILNRDSQKKNLLKNFGYLPADTILPDGKSANGRFTVKGLEVGYVAGQYAAVEIWEAAESYLSSIFEQDRQTSGRLPSVKSLESAFPGYGKELRKCLESVSHSEIIADQYIQTCHHRPDGISIILSACDLIAETCGVEYIQCKKDGFYIGEQYGLSYLNTGETYATTLIYDHRTDNYRVCDWGTIVENRPNFYV